MIASQTVARRYAEALFVAARGEDQVNAIERDLASLSALVERTPQFLEALHNPLLPVERKQAIIHRLLGEEVQPITLRMLNLLVEKRRSEVLPYLYSLYTEMANDYRGVAQASVVSAMPLTPEEEEALVSRLAAMTGKRIELRTEVRPELIGGLRVTVGDTVIDGTVVGYLRQLRGRLKEALL
ncbi:MAG TPA: ATP synthase F1 subunit delta [Armatimonadota bacterium]|nr:ATP synthase F1 subunit delta [Armatimonadota bacterium]HOJ21563.1 ATP synthase F1 subunit delta [Armatimonadota bacterium]HOM83428.1 ATP synthase F1 subunit delta [Armatimonadota bacterium]HOQ27766.1 ATP synthase F1 subunit delta [Armatimonadota bacterium]HPO74145.1 ATP synthase F1 subunit delta [Armatimonadota bacterium]